jgi:hypothetical protein
MKRWAVERNRRRTVEGRRGRGEREGERKA